MTTTPEAPVTVTQAKHPLEAALDGLGLVLTDDPDFDHDEQTFGKAMDVAFARIAADQSASPSGLVEMSDIEWLNIKHSRANSQGDHAKQRMLERLLRAALAAPATAGEGEKTGFRAIKPASEAHAAVLEDLARRIDDE